MHRFCRSHLLYIWCCAILLVFSYVLFDLLDVDGSNFRGFEEGLTVAEEVHADKGGEKDCFKGIFATWSGTFLPSQLASPSLSIVRSPSSPLIRVALVSVLPRSTIPVRVTSSSPQEGEPARRPA
jgi:hypothetical protein